MTTLGKVKRGGKLSLARVRGLRRRIVGVSSRITSQPCEEPHRRLRWEAASGRLRRWILWSERSRKGRWD